MEPKKRRFESQLLEVSMSLTRPSRAMRVPAEATNRSPGWTSATGELAARTGPAPPLARARGSITQQFNTTTSMGRLTLNVLLSFAQFEREITGERIRDKIAASKKKGMWMGGLPALGYDVQDRKLVVNEQEALTVCHIFRRYVQLRSVRALQAGLDGAGIRSKRRVCFRDKEHGGALSRLQRMCSS
jgi:hypothetical protein